MLERITKVLAVLGLAVAIGAVGMAVRSTLRAGDIQGPVALVVTPAQEVWLGVDHELWRVAADGRLLDMQPLSSIGLPGAPANLVRHPDGSIVASVRKDPTLYVLDAASARVVRTLRLQWPADLQSHGSRAIHFAFDATGRVATATGGGHAVALFGADGALLARTAPGRYEFTNGLWWAHDGLWTTDTNRFTLRLLDATTLDERRAVDLGQAAGGSFLGPARARSVGGGMPMAALIRYHGDMTEGGVALIGADARAKSLPYTKTMAPRDLDWLGDELLVTDGVSFSVLRWTAAAREMSPFGDHALQQRLQARVHERDALRRAYARWLAAAVAALALGITCAAAASWLARRAQPRPSLDLSKLGTPRVGRMALARLHWRMSGAMVLGLSPLLLIEFVPVGSIKAALGENARIIAVGIVVALLLAMLLVLPLMLRRLRRLATLPEFEPAFNQRAMRMLDQHASTVAAALQPDEQVLEVFAPLPGLLWYVLTSKRLLGFSATLFEHKLTAIHELAEVSAASTEPGRAAPDRDGRRWGARAGKVAWLEIGFQTAPPIRGAVGSTVLAARLAACIQSLATAVRAQRGRRPVTAAHASRDEREAFEARRRLRALASALVPGLGQWLQRRGPAAIACMSLWAAGLFFFTIPLLWTLVEPFTGVRSIDIVAGVLGYLGLSAIAAVEAWHAEVSPLPHSPGA